MGRLFAVLLMVAALPAWGQMSVSAAMRARGAVAARASSASASASSSAAASLPASVDDALAAMFADADTVFAGEVTAIERVDGAVLVRLRVDEGVRGASAGEVVTLREWSGLWADGAARYVVGQRSLFLLRAASVAGFASPVADGVIPLHGAVAGATADLRWVEQHVAVTDAARLAPLLALRAAGGVMEDASGLQAAEEAARGAAVEGREQGSVGAVDPYEAADGGVVMDMLHALQRLAGAAR